MKKFFTDGGNKFFIENLYDLEKPLRFRPATENELKIYKIKCDRKNKLKKLNNVTKNKQM